ncbi:MAG: hypothetical protein ABIR56_14735 [Polaromonas sp.]
MTVSTAVVEGMVQPSGSGIDSTYRKITWRLMPFLAFLWLRQIANGSHSDRQQEVRWHCAGAILLGAIGLLIAALSQGAARSWCCLAG